MTAKFLTRTKKSSYNNSAILLFPLLKEGLIDFSGHLVSPQVIRERIHKYHNCLRNIFEGRRSQELIKQYCDKCVFNQ